MRNMLLSATSVIGLVAAVLASGGAQANVLGGSAGVRTALDAVSTIDSVGCWRPGWHGWGWYPYCGPRYYGGDRDWRWHRHGWDDDEGWRRHRWHRWGGWHRGHDWD